MTLSLKRTGRIFSLIAGLFLCIAAISVVTASTRQDTIEAMSNSQKANLDQFMGNTGNANIVFLGCSVTGACFDSQGEPISTGALPFAGEAIAGLVDQPPIYAGHWLQDTLHNIDPSITPVYAQSFGGIGFSSLTPVLQIWKVFRNIAYALFVVIFVVIGFMIMMRSQINPQTVVNIQTALPKLVITLLLITFSYAIAGFVVDLLFFSIYLITGAFVAAGILADSQQTLNLFFDRSIIYVLMKYFAGSSEIAGDSADAVAALVSSALGGVGTLLDGIIEGLAYLIIAVAILIAAYRTLFSLIISYVSIIVSVIFAPIQLITHAFPGSNTFGTWLRGIVANAAVFPAVTAFLIIGAALGGGGGQQLVSEFGLDPYFVNQNTGNYVAGSGSSRQGFVPPLITSRARTGADAVRVVIGLGMIMLLPEIAGLIKKQLGAESQLGELAFNNFSQGYKRGPVAWAGRTAAGVGGMAKGAAQYAGSIGLQYGTIRTLQSPLFRNTIGRIPIVGRTLTGAADWAGNKGPEVVQNQNNNLPANDRGGVTQSQPGSGTTPG